MKILLAASLYPPETRGPATFAGQLVEHLSAGGNAPVVVPFREVLFLPPLVRHIVYAIKLLVRGRGAKVVVALDPVSVGLPAFVASRLLRSRLVIRVVGDYAWEQGVQHFSIKELLDEFTKADKSRYPLRVQLLYWLQCFVATRADRVVVPSNYLKGVIQNWGIVHSRIVVIKSAAGKAPGSLSREDIRQRIGWGEEGVVFSVGELVPWKGFEALIDAAALVRKELPTTRLIIAGGGDRKALQAHATRAGFDPQSVLIGELPHTILLELLRAADVFALNTTYEGFSHALLEAMQAGVSIVTTPAGGNSELIADGHTGLLVPVNNVSALAAAIRELLTNKKRAALLASAARKKAAEYSPEISMAAWEGLLKKV